ncbi:MAG: hypothetical protein ACR2OG_01550 [Gemmatimonadaceae bacterium]
MPLVYLDTSHLALLADARRKDPVRYREFCRLWRERDCTLALSHVHAGELRRDPTRQRRRARFAVVADLLPVRTDIAILPGTFPTLQPLLKRELWATLLARDVLRIRGDLPADFHLGLPQLLTTAADIEALRSVLESWRVGVMFRLMHTAEETGARATQLGAEAGRRDTGSTGSTKRTRTRLGDLGDVPPSPEQRAGLLDPIEKNMRGSSWLWRIMWYRLPRAVREAAGAQVREPMERFFDRAEASGTQNAYAEFTDAASGAKTRRRFIDDLGAEYLIRQATIELLTADLRVIEAEQAAVVAGALTLADAPGMWLREHAQRKLLNGGRTYTVRDGRDLDHLSYAPWVNVFFSDGPTAEYARQALKDAPEGLLLRVRPLNVPRSLAALSGALDQATRNSRS